MLTNEYLCVIMVEVMIKALTKSAYNVKLLREMAVGASHSGFYMFVASEPEGRKPSLASRTFP